MRVLERVAEPVRVFGDVFRNRDLLLLELAWAASNLATRASAIAIAVYAYETDGIGAVGIVAFIRLAVAAGASSWVAVLADRRPRRQVLIGSDLVRGLLLGAIAALALAGTASLGVYALAVLVAVAEPLFRAAQVAHMPALVRTPQELTAANVLASGVESVGLFAGPAVGALLLSVSSTGAVLAATAGLSLVSVALVSRIGATGAPAPTATSGRQAELIAGWRAIAVEPGLRVVIALFSAQTFVAGMLNVTIVVLAIEVLDLGTAGVGWLDGVVGIGAAAGIAVVAGAAGRSRLSPYFGAGLALWGLPFVAIAAWPELAPVIVLLALVGIGNTLVDVTGITLMQRAAPDHVLGRVFGAFEALVLLTMALGSLVTPLLLALAGTRWTIAISGLVLPVLLVPLWRRLDAVDAATPAPAEEVELLRRLPIFAPLAPPQLDRLGQALVELHVEPGSAVFEQGDAGDRFYVVADGRAAVELDGEVVRELGPGDFFGEIALLRDVPRTATVRALERLRLLALDRETFVGTVTGHAASAEAAGSIVAARLPGPVIG